MALSNEQFKEVHKKNIERMRFLVAKGKQERLDAACEREEIKQQLKRDLKNCDTLYTLVDHVSQSGMTRDIRVFMIKDNKPLNISYKVAKVLKRRQGKNTGVRVQGCGMDMGFEIVYNLSRCLFKDGYKINQRWL
jgi:hypothetical protein